MAEIVYKIIEIVGTSPTSWEKAAAAAVEHASQTLRDLRVAQVCEQDVTISDGKVEAYRVRLKLSFKFEAEGARGETPAPKAQAAAPKAASKKKASKKRR